MTFTAHTDAWLGEIMRRPVFRVEKRGDGGRVEVGAGQGAADIARASRDEIDASGIGDAPGFYFAKVPTDRVADVVALSARGFAVVDTNVTFELVREPEAPQLEVGEIRADEADAVLAIAGSAFRYSRFHLDPAVGQGLAHLIKRAWIENYVLRKRGDTLLVARDGGKPIGFLAPIVAHGTAVIDLVAVATDAHGRGAGSALCQAFAAKYRGMPRIVGTQVANVPSIRLYTKLGFLLQKSSYVLHLHR